MAYKRTKKIKLIPLLLGLIILTTIIGLLIKVIPFNQPPSVQNPASTQSVAEEGINILSEASGDPIRNCVSDDDNIKKQNKDKELTCKSVSCAYSPAGSPVFYNETLTTYKNNDRVRNTVTKVACPESTDTCRSNPAKWPDFQSSIACIKYTAAGADASCPGGILDYPNYSLCLSNVSDTINGVPVLDKTVNFVKLTVKDIPAKSTESTSGAKDQNTYYYCLRTNPKDCDDDDIKNNKVDVKDGKIVIDRLCGDGSNKLKVNTNCDNDGSDWFHQEKTYRITFFEKPKVVSPQAAQVSFYISHMYPEIIEPKNTSDKDITFSQKALESKRSINVVLEGRTKAQENGNAQNSYWVRLVGVDNDYKSAEGCVYVPYGGQRGSTSLELTDYVDPVSKNVIAKISAGNYFLQIKEGTELSNDKKSCKEGKFTYYHVPIRVGQGDNPGFVGTPIKDPNRKEIGLQQPQISSPPVCDFEDIDTTTGYCKKIKTALGIKISTEPMAFVADVFSIVLMIGGIAAVVFIIQAGFTLLTSAGNKEKVAHAREQITSAIMGLIFIILSITILEFIGVNILHIPGLGN